MEGDSMIKAIVKHSDISVLIDGKLASGSEGISVQFSFTDEWADLVKTAVFKCANRQIIIPVENGAATVPWGLLLYPGENLYIGVYGRNAAGDVILPTVWSNPLLVHEGVSLG